MLSHFLRAAAGNTEDLPIEYVGGYVEGFGGTSSNKIISLTSLTGGIGSRPSPGDFVLVYFGTGSNNNRNLIIAGYTEIDDLSSSDTIRTNLTVGYKFMGVTPDTSFTLTGGTLNSDDAGAVYVSVWRNVDVSSPLAVTSTTERGSNSVLCNPPAITPFFTPGAVIVAGGSGGHTDGTDTYSSSDLTAFRSVGGNDTYDVTIGGGYSISSYPGATFNPAAFTFSGTDSNEFSWAAITTALNPKNTTYTKPFVVNTNAVTNSTTLSVPAHQDGDWLVIVNGAQSQTPPSLLSGYTNIASFFSSGNNRSGRAQYIISDGSISSVTVAYYGLVAIVRNVSGLGAVTSVNANSTIFNLATSISGVNVDSLCLFASYVGTAVTGATNMDFVPNFGGSELVISGSTAGGTITYSGLIAGIYFGAEFI
jgi:hypothetical protein